MEKRCVVVGVLVENPQKNLLQVYDILNEFREVVKGQITLPYFLEHQTAIALITYANTDEIGALTGKLGRIKQVKLKSIIPK